MPNRIIDQPDEIVSPDAGAELLRGTRAVRAIRQRQDGAWVVAIPELGIVTPPQGRRSAARQARTIVTIAFGTSSHVRLRITESRSHQMIQVTNKPADLDRLLTWLGSHE